MIKKLLSIFFLGYGLRLKENLFFAIFTFFILVFTFGFSSSGKAENPDILLVKSGELYSANNRILFTITVTNTGDVPLHNILLTDLKLFLPNPIPATKVLAPHESLTFTYRYAITLREKDLGRVVNVAYITAYSPAGTKVHKPSQPTPTVLGETVIIVPETPSITLVKSAILSTDKKTINYNFVLKNTGNVTLNNLTLTDPKLPGAFVIDPAEKLPSQSVKTFSAVYTITQADKDADMAINSAIATGVSPVNKITVQDISGSTQADDQRTVVPLPEQPSVRLIKTGALSTDGNSVLYSFSIINTGDVTLKNLTITDHQLTGGTNTFTPSVDLAPGVTAVSRETYTLTQAEKDAGSVTNTATVTGRTTGGTVTDISGTTQDNDIATITIIPPHPSLTLVKTGLLNADQSKIQYNFTITNTGNVTLNNLTLSDQMFPSLVINPSAKLLPGENYTLTADYLVTQADKDANKVTNTALVSALSNLGIPVQDVSGTAQNNDQPTVVVIPENHAITLVKTGIYNADNNTITYTFKVTNAGTVTLKNVSMTDPQISGAFIFSPAGDLAPGQITVATSIYTVAAAEKDIGQVVNTAKVTAVTINGIVTTDISGTAANNNTPTLVVVSQNATVKLLKTGVLSADGNTITYNFTIANQGDLSLKNLVLTDPKLPGSLTIDPALVIRPGTSRVVTAAYQVSQAEKDAHQVINTATVTGTSFTNKTATDISGTSFRTDDPTVVAVPEAPAVNLVKTGVLSADENTVNYTFTLSNTGNVTLRNLVLTDARLPAFLIDPAFSLAPGSVKILTASYAISQIEKDAVMVSNTAVVKGVSPAGTVVSDISGTSRSNDIPTVVEVPEAASIRLTKLASGNIPALPGSLVNYTLKVTNTGTVTLRNIVISDANAVITGGSPISAIASNEVAVVTATHTVTQSDIDAGKIINQALATGSRVNGDSVTSLSDDPSTVAANDPTVTVIAASGAIALVKTGIVDINATLINYTFTITNTGNVTLKNIVINDALLGGAINLDEVVLSPSQSVVITKSYHLNQNDRDNAEVTNSATVVALTPAGLTVTDISGTDIQNNTPTVVKIETIPAINLVLTGVITTDFSTVTYSYKITNTGNVRLVNLNLADAKLSSRVTLSSSTIDPGGMLSGVAVYTVTDQEKRDGIVTNTATITGYTPAGGGFASDISGTEADSDAPTVILIDKAPQAINDHAATTIDHPVIFSLTENDLPSFNGLDAGSIVITKYALFGQLETHFDGTVTYRPNKGYAGQDDFMYSVTDLRGRVSNKAMVNITISLIDLFIPNTVTPNGDGKNDTFKIVGKEDFDSMDLLIVNRWGNEVYHNKNYQDDWGGSGLNNGTYFYVIVLKKGAVQVVKKGWVLLKR